MFVIDGRENTRVCSFEKFYPKTEVHSSIFEIQNH